MPPSTPRNLYDLGLRGALYLASLLVAHDERVPVTPTPSLTHAAMALLRDRGVIEVPWPAPSWDIAPDAKRAPIEQLQWRLIWPPYEVGRLGEALGDYFLEVVADEAFLTDRVELWRDLAAAEAQYFFQDQLLKHRLDAEWATDLLHLHQEQRAELSAAQWRYCGWAAVRYGAAALQRNPHRSMDSLREAIYGELCRRASMLATGQWGKCAFPPFGAMPGSAAGRLFVTHLAPLGMDYWTRVPNSEALHV